jgi:outer membrane protein assembly factor BamB
MNRFALRISRHWRIVGVPLALCLAVLATGSAVALPAQDTGVMMIPVEGEGRNYWPRWRGPSGQGLVSGGPYTDAWSDTENVLWRTPVPGSGNSSPIVWDDRIYLTTAYDNGRRLSLVAFDRASGELAWESFAPDGRTERVHDKNGHASATPLTDGQRIYASFGSRGLVAFDREGAVVWQQEFGALDNYWGTAGSPLLYRDRIIVYQDVSGGSFVAAFDRETGEQIWNTERDQTVGWGSPIAIHAGDHDEIIVHGQRRVQAYDPETGSELWHCNGSTVEVIPTAVVGYGMLFCPSGRAGPTLAIRPGGAGDVTETHLEWTSPRGSPFVPSPILYEDNLYLVNDMQSIATALNARTGESVWQGRLGVARREGFSASPVAVDGKVFFTNDYGETFVLRAGDEFEILRVNELGEPVLASPALVDGRWYFRTASHLVAIGGGE